MTMKASKKRWYALYTKPHREYAVRDYPAERDIEVYLPEIANKTQRRGRPAALPFFLQYLFARLDLQVEILAHVRWMPGLRSIVSFGEVPAPVPDGIVAHIRRRMDEKAVSGLEGPSVRTEPERVADGPFEDLDALLDHAISPQGRVDVLLHYILREMEAHLDRDHRPPSH